jgi:hypothetical protein
MNIAQKAQSLQKEQNGLRYSCELASGIQQKKSMRVWDDKIIQIVIVRDKEFSEGPSFGISL